ncbi:uncharacterized protein LOC129220492 [Uloborus diversus]|uniref:uncharacterized protein LOC129220492 n=1 Tax=Uloborus diversus TaxID=327109 RepID=UPI00240943DD|nr:uncharacterized protein LOC129220492 [Uloborus diversus]XP_054710886.1 uncharacterized protein LOC129220492 [Uloborus diversus]XP_054710887.1 uncharacterized protein LOC129220492 [Uloborus diversus]
MPFKCSVPGCQSNYYPPYVTCFRFPQNLGKRKLWIKQIQRENFTFSKSARVCIKHFAEQMVVWEDDWTDKYGITHKIKRMNPTLTVDAFPCFIEKCTPHRKKRSPNKNEKTRDSKEELIQECLANGIVMDDNETEREKLCDLSQVNMYAKDCLHNYPNWSYIVHDEQLTAVKLSVLDIPCVEISFRISSDLSFEIYSCKDRLNVNNLGLTFKKLESKDQFDVLLKVCNDYNFKENHTDKFSNVQRRQLGLKSGGAKKIILKFAFLSAAKKKKAEEKIAKREVRTKKEQRETRKKNLFKNA